MFGFSFAELVLVLLVGIIFIRPQDLPEVAHLIGRAIFHGKMLMTKIRNSFRELEKDAAVQELRNELNRGLAEEKTKNDEDSTIIVDMFGNEHRVSNIGEIRPDIDQEMLAKEVAEANSTNLQKIKQQANENLKKND